MTESTVSADRIEAVARAIFEADEDLNDQTEARLRAEGNLVAADCLCGPRARWDDPRNAPILDAFRFRAAAAIKATEALAASSPARGIKDGASPSRKKTERYHRRPFEGFAPGDTARREQIISLPMNVILAVFAERLEYYSSSERDPIATLQNAGFELEKAMGIYPNCSPIAPGIETGTATTEGRGAQHESPVTAGQAPASDPPTPAQAPDKAGEREILDDVKAVADEMAQACIEAGDNKGAGAFQYISGLIADRLAVLAPAPTGTEAATPHQSDSGEIIRILEAVSRSAVMPDCMMPDGAAPCRAFTEMYEAICEALAMLAARPTPAQPRAEG